MERIVVYEPYAWAGGLIAAGLITVVGFIVSYYATDKKKPWLLIPGFLAIPVFIFGILSCNLESLQKPVNQYLVDKKVIPQIDFGRYQVIGQQGDTFLLERIEHTRTFRVDNRR